MKYAVAALFFLSLFSSTFVHAGIFLCKDASGRTLTSDRPIPECADRAVREYGNNGLLRREISAPLTAAQQRAKVAQEEKKKAEQAAAEEQRKADRALLARYRSEDDIARSRGRDSAVVNERIAQQKTALTNAEKEQKAMQLAADTQKQKGPVPPRLKSQLEQAAQNVRDAAASLQESETDLAHVSTRYDLALQRYREIAGAASFQQVGSR